jgi:hypothetical protein
LLIHFSNEFDMNDVINLDPEDGSSGKKNSAQNY